MKVIPHDPALDSTIALLREGYDFIARRCDRLGTDIFATRLMLKRAICVRGASAAEMFYGGNHFTRNGAMPQTTMRLLQDKGSVQSLDDGAHRHRKAMFLSILLAPEQVEDFPRGVARSGRALAAARRDQPVRGGELDTDEIRCAMVGTAARRKEPGGSLP
ncbi:hypothetical protein [Mesorhizobium sp.]|uniref:hypothetical protein n=1 Tax=Mesorhizobium sp. TaxID=1871066 RepID=UPI00121C55D4|nr:hypothetical protein [Mesorhizobium sp.]TIT01602.1 MAG: hypothetical protein E5W87_14235 [Mesorhizobium sp.]